MANTLTGKVIAVSQIETIASKDPNKQPMQKRSLYMDCTRYDPYTGERGYENTPLLEFGGKAMEKLNELVNNGLKKDDIVVVSFDVQGTPYEKDGKKQVFTRVRPFDIELKPKPQQTQEAPAPAPAPVEATTSKDGKDDLPFN